MPFTKNFHAAAAAVIDKKKKTFKKRQCCRFFRLCVAERFYKLDVAGIQSPDARSAEV